MKVALLSNVTVEVLAGMLREEHAVWTPSGFGAWMETALDPPEEMLAFAPDLIGLLIDRRFGDFDGSLQDVLVARHALQERFPKAAVIVPRLDALADDFGEAFYDERMWKLGRMPFSLRGLRELAKLFSLRKAVAVDLDNTLWSGIIGEDGAGGLVPDVALQTKLLDLKRRGVLLIAVSKNNPEDVAAAWNVPHMALAPGDFAAMAVNWQSKPDNLRRLAAELNLAPDTFVFVDDSPAERAEMRARLPEVAVAEFPPDLDFRFPFAAAASVDGDRTAAYHEEACRREFAAAAETVEDYLKGLEISVEVRAAEAADAPRLAQLSQRVNQFNVCTNRYSQDEIAALIADGSRQLFVASARDRFGDYGLIALVQVKFTDDDGAEIVDWMMSCRAMNRRIEFTVEAEVERQLGLRGVGRILATWRRTPKNAPVREFYDRLGFTLLAATDDERKYSRKTTR